MAIRHWSGRRLIGTWVAGVAGEVVLLALPVAFFMVTLFLPGRSEFAIGGAPHLNALPEREIGVERLRLADEKILRVERSVGPSMVVVPPPPSAPSPTAVALSRSIPEAVAMQLEPAPWYALPMAGAIALYVLTIPLGLIVITLMWVIYRLAGYRPPPRTS